MSQSLKLIRSFLLLSCVATAAVVVAIFVSYQFRTERLTEDILLQQARALFTEMVLNRQGLPAPGAVHAASHTPREPASRFLAASTNSGLAEKKGGLKLHLATLTPVANQASAPDPFERQALLAFANGAKEAHVIENTASGEVYRYMAPLCLRPDCRNCPDSQGCENKDVRSGVSITIPMASLSAGLAENRRVALLNALLVVALLSGFLFFQSTRCMRRMEAAQAHLTTMATLDSLTGLLNRRTVYERLEEEIAKHRRFKTPLSCLLLDIDHFKEVNDSYGHLAGDAVLVALAENLKSHSRRYDIISRYGGEEFLIILPVTDLAAAVAVAEKLRQQIADFRVSFADTTLQVTVSIGVAQFLAAEQADDLVGRADTALYQAKRDSRNRVVAFAA